MATNDLPPLKRRRLDVASALSKPFKPPLRLPRAAEPELSLLSPPSASPVNSLRNPGLQRPGLPTRTISSHGALEAQALQRQKGILRSRLISLRAELDNAKQALRIESSNNDVELETLIIKWRNVSQRAADEVFDGARERVNRMGGMAAWRERAKQDTSPWDFENECHGEGDEIEGEDESLYSEKRSIEDTPGPAEEEEFTMEYMLKMLHIDPKIIGFDAVTGNWIRQ